MQNIRYFIHATTKADFTVYLNVHVTVNMLFADDMSCHVAINKLPLHITITGEKRTRTVWRNM